MVTQKKDGLRYVSEKTKRGTRHCVHSGRGETGGEFRPCGDKFRIRVREEMGNGGKFGRFFMQSGLKQTCVFLISDVLKKYYLIQIVKWTLNKLTQVNGE